MTIEGGSVEGGEMTNEGLVVGRGVIDLVEMKAILWHDEEGKEREVTDIADSEVVEAGSTVRSSITMLSQPRYDCPGSTIVKLPVSV